jgi:carboxyl-terminal processing protease
MFRKYLLYSFVFLLGLVVFSCQKDSEIELSSHADSVLYVNKKVESLMHDIYLWNGNVPSGISPSNYSSPASYLDALIFKPIDKWSFIITKEEFNSYFVTGKYYGHGFAFELDNNNNFRISFIYEKSDLKAVGVKRGWIIKQINNTKVDTTNIGNLLGPSELGVTNKFQFQKPDSSVVELSFTKKEIQSNTVLHYDTLHISNKIVGHVVFKGFVTTAKEEITTVFNYFKLTNVTEVIFDLRYNGGGETEIAHYIANIMGGNIANGQIFAKMTFNSKNSSKNWNYNFEKNSLSQDFNSFYFITSGRTASASEDLINGLKPFFQQKLIGTTTSGKPTGMNVMRILDYYFAPVTFKVANSEGFGDFYDGLKVDCEVQDDLTHDFGDRNEACLAQAIHYIEFGNFEILKQARIQTKRFNHKLNCFDGMIGGY